MQPLFSQGWSVRDPPVHAGEPAAAAWPACSRVTHAHFQDVVLLLTGAPGIPAATQLIGATAVRRTSKAIVLAVHCAVGKSSLSGTWTSNVLLCSHCFPSGGEKWGMEFSPL